MYEIVFSKSAKKELFKLPNSVIEKIDKAILSLAENPKPMGCIKLESFKDLYRIRIGNYRVIYRIENDVLIVEIVKIADRKEIYK